MTPIARAQSAADEVYIRTSYATLDQLARGLGERAWPGVHLPRATYELADGSLWYPRDWWRLFDDALAWLRADAARASRATVDALALTDALAVPVDALATPTADEVAQTLARLPALFARRLTAAAHALGHAVDVDDEWASYLGGFYGACLRDVAPEAVVHKEALVAQLDRALAAPRPDDAAWCAALRAQVECLDGLCRPFAACDRIRFGRPTSRDRLITATHQRYPHVFA